MQFILDVFVWSLMWKYSRWTRASVQDLFLFFRGGLTDNQSQHVTSYFLFVKTLSFFVLGHFLKIRQFYILVPTESFSISLRRGRGIVFTHLIAVIWYHLSSKCIDLICTKKVERIEINLNMFGFIYWVKYLGNYFRPV